MFRGSKHGGFAVAAIFLAVTAGGCANWQGPRIDPSGERLFIWPNQYPGALPYPGAPAPYPGAPVVAPSPPPGIPPGNLQVAPIYSDPFLPGAGGPVTPVGPSTVFGPTIGPAVAGTMPFVPAITPTGVTSPLQSSGPAGVDKVVIGPPRVLAPVGSEVILRAGMCSTSGHLLTDQRVQWSLSGSGMGQFTDSRDWGVVDMVNWFSDSPGKINNCFAVTVTSWGNTCLRRGTPNPNDDVQIHSGEAWIGITSPTEGTSFVTAVMPIVADANSRQATAIIDWMDVRWIFPANATVEPGKSHTLSTIVMRQTNGTPLAGWTVRYQVASGGALGYEGTGLVEAVTEASGRASVELSPTNTSGGTATIEATLIRPDQGGIAPTGPIEIARGITTITWMAGGAVTVPPSESFPPIAPITPPASREPPPSETRPPVSQPAGRAQLDVRAQLDGPSTVNVGDEVTFQVTVTNRGDGPARRIVVMDRFDRGLQHPSAKLNEFEVKYEGMRELPPGDSAIVPLTFKVEAAGNLCHEVTVTAEDGARGTDRGCITARATAPAAQPTLDVRMIGPAQGLVGGTALFRIVVANTGSVPATNLEIVNQYDPALDPTSAEEGHEALLDRKLLWRVDRLEATEKREFRIEYRYVRQSASACNRVLVTGDNGVSYADEVCPEVLPPRQGEGSPSDAAAPPASAASLRLQLLASSNPARVGESTTVLLTLSNSSQILATNVRLSILLPPELAPDTTLIQSSVDWRIDAEAGGQVIRFNPIAEVRSLEQLRISIPARVNREGRARILVQLTADGIEPINQSQEVDILPRSP